MNNNNSRSSLVNFGLKLSSPGYSYQLQAIARWLLLITIIIAFSFIGGGNFEDVDAATIAATMKAENPFFRQIPLSFLTMMVYIFHPVNARYMLPPIAAFAFVMIAGALYVQDLYALPSFRNSLRYVIASLFGLRYPVLTIDDGEKKLKKGETNLIDAIGGPGFVLIQPGNAVLFRLLRHPSLVGITESVFLEPFETIGSIVNLDDQHGHIDELITMTRDGIKVRLMDINFRFRIITSQESQRSLRSPYPFSPDAFRRLSTGLPVDDDGQVSWNTYTSMLVKSAIIDYVNEHDIDFLTAPRASEQDPRRDFRDKVLEESNRRVQDTGTEMLWIDSGHFDIMDPDVAAERINYWAAEWAGHAEENRAYSEAKRQAYQELGRAEAQAELIMGISSALSEMPRSKSPNQNIRNLLLLRTAQILDAMKDSRTGDVASRPARRDKK